MGASFLCMCFQVSATFVLIEFFVRECKNRASKRRTACRHPHANHNIFIDSLDVFDRSVSRIPVHIIWRYGSNVFIEEIRIHALHFVRLRRRDTEVVLDHQLCQTFTVNEDDFCRHLFLCEINCTRGKFCRCDKNAFRRALPCQSAQKLLDFWTRNS